MNADVISIILKFSEFSNFQTIYFIDKQWCQMTRYEIQRRLRLLSNTTTSCISQTFMESSYLQTYITQHGASDLLSALFILEEGCTDVEKWKMHDYPINVLDATSNENFDILLHHPLMHYYLNNVTRDWMAVEQFRMIYRRMSDYKRVQLRKLILQLRKCSDIYILY